MSRNKNAAAPVLFILAGIAVWQGAVTFSGIQPWLLPSPLKVMATLWEMLPLLAKHSGSTLLAAVSGLLAAVLLALCLAAVMDLSPWFKQGLYPLLVLSQTVPIISVAPLFLIWFGLGLFPKIVVVALVCFFPVAVSTVAGMESADPAMVNLLKVMGSSRWQIIRLVRLPAALPSFFAGLKIAGTYAVMGAVIGEWLGASSGLGVYMTRASHSYQLDRVFAAIFVISLVSLLLFLLITLLARLAMPWYYKERNNDNV
ncbi:hydroxymethylpyrimidine ABC transporter, transmembrane component [Desulfocucumis palustris]|uniref:Hydroxymethylpyrimidine ABC transporter, transmembrane component n=1 Tax=Desulfocucumis palustris TaxID=1898651 RepID=A0A2L2XCU9_9FIRM|nr:ABC transporter permease [Desulfocucumis palustris]GBF34055.1 hydroxymethylpyrimidine ABC transporter, transmembrane component [Desulfocucumis palustris]